MAAGKEEDTELKADLLRLGAAFWFTMPVRAVAVAAVAVAAVATVAVRAWAVRPIAVGALAAGPMAVGVLPEGAGCFGTYRSA